MTTQACEGSSAPLFRARLSYQRGETVDTFSPRKDDRRTLGFGNTVGGGGGGDRGVRGVRSFCGCSIPRPLNLPITKRTPRRGNRLGDDSTAQFNQFKADGAFLERLEC